MFNGVAIGVGYGGFGGSAPAPYVGLLDLYPGASAAYSLRKLSGSYSGPAIQVRRDNGGVTDIGFTSSGDLDVDSLLAFCSTGSGSITTFYDQSGTDKNATQANAVNQPKIVSEGSLITMGSKPCLQFTNSSGQFLSHNFPIWTYTGNSTLFHVSRNRQLSSANYGAVISQGGGTGSQALGIMWQQYNSANTQACTDIFAASGLITSTTQSPNTRYLASFKWENWSTHRTNGNSIIAINGQNQALTTYGGASPSGLVSSPVRIGSFDGVPNAGSFLGDVQEIVIYTTAYSQEIIDGIEQNINSYYGVF